MTFAADWLLVLVVVPRCLGLAWTAPGWGAAGVGWRLRLGLAVLLAAALAPLVGLGDAPTPDVVAWGRLALAEVAVGAALGMAAALVVAGARQAGELVAVQAGLMPASLLDPEPLGADDAGGLTPLGHLYGWVALMVFLGLGGPLLLVDALARSYQVIPPGGAVADPSLSVTLLCGRVGEALGLALRAAAPAGLATLLAGLALAVVARGRGARPLTGLAWPIRAALGLALAALALPALAMTLAAAWRGWAAWVGE